MPHYLALYKPYGVLSQFSDEGHKKGLGSILDLPGEVYPVGRLDADSEGVLLLTDNRKITDRLLNPKYQHWRTYYAQVEGRIDKKALEQLRNPMTIRLKKQSHQTLPARVEILDTPPALPDRNPPIRYRKNIPTSWVSISLREGKNRQVRKMTASVGFPTLRLVRWAVEDITAENLKPGEVKSYQEREFFTLLSL